MKLQARLLLLATIAAALIVSRCVVVVAGAGSHAMPVHAALRGSVEDDVGVFAELEEEAAYPHRRVLAGSVSYGSLQGNRPACPGSCPAPGQPYTGRGCQQKYGCRGR